MLAESAGAVRSNQGPRCEAELALSGDLPLDILIVPGGMGTRREMKNAPFLDALSRRADACPLVASVCTGSLLLARAGLLDGRRATTNKRAFSWVASQTPGVTWVAQARWVEDGKYFTSSGVSAGMDMALAIIARLFGREASAKAASRAEYEWHEDSAWDPFAVENGLA